MKFVLGRVENIVGKGENAGYQRFLLFHNVLKGFLSRVIKSPDCVVKGYSEFSPGLYGIAPRYALKILTRATTPWNHRYALIWSPIQLGVKLN